MEPVNYNPGNFLNQHKLEPVPYGKPYPMFTRVSIETSSICTRSCWHCPAGKRGKQLHVMSDEMYDTILDELTTLDFQGVVQWFYCNEPLMDKKYLVRINQLRTACPKVTIHLTTNWDTKRKLPIQLQRAAIAELFRAGVNSLNINDYDESGDAERLLSEENQSWLQVQFGRLKFGAHNWKKIGAHNKHFSVSTGVPTELHSWSGNNESNMGGHGHCARPARHIVVMWDGRVPLCCAVDPTIALSFGNVGQSTLHEIWNSLEMFRYRYYLGKGIRQGECANCTATVAYPHVFRRVTIPEELL